MASERPDPRVVELHDHAARLLLARLGRLIPKGAEGRTAELAGITPQHLSRWKHRKAAVNPSLATLAGFAVALDVSIASLIAADTDSDGRDFLASEVRNRELQTRLRELLDELEELLVRYRGAVSFEE